jgi:uncharacterized integral membrane protein
MISWREAEAVIPMADQVARPGPDRKRMSGGAVTGLVAAIVLLIFMFQNTDDIRVRFLFLHFTWPLWLYTFGVSVFGALLWFGLGVMRRHRRREQRREER